MFIWAIALGVGVLGAIPYVIWMVVTAVKKRWRKLSILIVIPFATWGILTVTTGFMDRAAYRGYLSGIYDTEVDHGDPISEYHSTRAFNGDGFSIRTYRLSDSVRKRFESPDKSLLTQFPKRPSYRDDWDTEHWREAPFEPEHEDYLSFALGYYGGENISVLSQHMNDEIRSALKRKGTFYSFFKKDHGNHPGNIDMFIVDLAGGRIYEINNNT